VASLVFLLLVIGAAVVAERPRAQRAAFEDERKRRANPPDHPYGVQR
jgi:hypothetical protein